MSTTTGNPSRGAAIAPSDEAYAAWRAAVAKVLAKPRKVPPGDLGAEPEQLLATTTYDDVVLAPLYTGRDELPEPPLPGRPPFVRGRTASRDVTLGWHVAVRHGHTPAPAEDVNEALLTDLTSGATALWLTVGGTRPVGELVPLLAGVHVDLVPVVLDAGAEVTAAASLLLARAADADDPGAVDICLGADPYTSLLRNGSWGPGAGLDEAVALALVADGSAVAATGGSVRALLVDGTVLHDAGASDAEEVGAAVAAGLGYVRALVDAGFSVPSALRHIDFRFAVTDDQFQGIAKLRAARRLWARVADVLGAPEAGGMRQHAVTSAAMMAQRDPWVNLLRTTVAAFAAGVGGADVVTVLPFDAAIPGGAQDVSGGFSARLARNTQLLLLEESHVGRVTDAGGGSWYVESLTADLGGAAWAWLQQLEAAGGFVAAVASGLLAERVAATRARRDDDVAHRRAPLTGVSEFPNLAEAPLPPPPAEPVAGPFAPTRYAAAYERLRDRSDAHLAASSVRPQAFLATIGSTAGFTARATFVTNLLAAAGIEAVTAGPLAGADAASAAYRRSGAIVAVLCAADATYAEQGPQVVAALRAAGAGQVLVAGPARSSTGADGAPDGYLTLDMDAVAALTALLDRLGVA